MPVGGDIIEITYNHPDLGSGVFYPKSAEDSTIDYGGFRSNDDANMVDGGGNMIDQMNRARWSFETTCAMEMNVDDSLARLKALASSPKQASWTFSHINGSVWGGNGKPVGDPAGNGNAATFTLKCAGGGELKKIV
jgi:hypothetical protein